MKKMAIVLFVLLLGGFSRTVFAHPPLSISAEYDSLKRVLHVQINHVAHDNDEHYIRKLEIIKNGEEPITMYYKRQQTPTEFSADISLEAQDKDVVTIKSFSNEGGSLEHTIEIQIAEDKK